MAEFSWTSRSPVTKKLHGVFDLESGEPIMNPTFDAEKALKVIDSLKDDYDRYVLVVTEATVYRGVTYYPEGIEAL